ncbi:MAG: hypothetical protein WBE89_05440, partial [Methyloceanibacter sp.]
RKGEERIKSLWFFCLDRWGSFSTINLYFFNERSYFREATRQEIGSIIQFGSKISACRGISDAYRICGFYRASLGYSRSV